MNKLQIRRLGDPSDASATLLTLPHSDFPRAKKSSWNILSSTNGSHADVEEDDRLVLLSLPTKKEHGITIDDLTQGKTVYILGETSEHDIGHSSSANGHTGIGEDVHSNEGNIHVPVPARMLVEGTLESGHENYAGKTIELMRVETSNTYILVPPMPLAESDADANANSQDENSPNKRRKINGSPSTASTKKITTMPARSVGLIPGEESPACFFLEPIHLKPGHYASKLRWALSRWVYDPLDPPKEEKFGYNLGELSHICRTSEAEIGYALCHRVFGAEDAVIFPVGGENSSDSDGDGRRYGILSEEGRQTVSMAILSALLESDVELAWHLSEESTSKEGMDLSLLLKDVRTQWHNLEEDGVIPSKESQRDVPMLSNSHHETQSDTQSQFFTPAQFAVLRNGHDTEISLSDEVIWHCLRPMVRYTGCSHKDSMPSTIWLIPDEVARLAAHNVFLRGANAEGWNENEFMEAWNLRMPSISRYEPSLDLLRGIALSEVAASKEDVGLHPKEKVWHYFPEAGLPLVPSLRIKSMFAMRSVWTLNETIPYLHKFVDRDVERKDDKSSVDVEAGVKNILERFAKAVTDTEKSKGGGDVVLTTYVLFSK
ncbi:hypothetical protein HJC23_012857 [Cyclotella cryptica]|uniref:Sister chromatid cohesion protein DCC1 n=1 Tax=Cyclotella cryptica TaxID=29204 RepID=A0ABD3Q1T0_9STRA|eukprot:CCRYP_009433-RA/>CCRYP_009433-RA protein AED:0.21 eAED:0.32 QI:0/-1/0/1/-1/1/1/0/602